jgi:hypothetical protein
MNRIFHNEELKQINFLDNRYYLWHNDKGEEVYFPSVTTILNVYPKGFGFDQWLKDVGNNAQQIVERAGELGSKIHECCEHLNNGKQLKWLNEDGKPQYTLQEWEMLLRYYEFWTTCAPVLIANEQSTFNPAEEYAGTLDMVVMIGGVRWLLDIKSSNYLHKTYELQMAAYAMAWNVRNPDEPIEQTGILWLKASTLTSKIDLEKRIFQGKGWQIKSFERHYTDAYKIFKHVQAIWKEENPNYKPANKIYPDNIKLNSKIKIIE